MSVALGKLLLFGEHAVVYGYPAVGIPLPLKLRVHIQPTEKSHWDLPSPDNKLLELLNLIDKPLKISIDSEIPIGSGFGSSGALCVALARALHPTLPPEKIWAKAHHYEKVFHNSPSGIDTAISTFEMPCLFQNQKWTFLAKPQCSLVVGSLPRQGDTRELIRKVADSQRTDEIKKMGTIASQSIHAFNSPENFGQLATQAHGILRKLELSTPEMENLLEHSIKWGSLGGKMSGAGGGGAFFLVAKNPENASFLSDKIDQHFNLNTIILN